MQVQNGIAVVAANDPEYGRMKALATLGKAIFLGERYDEHGILTAAFQHPNSYQDNPEITIGGEFFMSALRDYRDWKEKWWREAIQNAVDANSTSIECGATKNQDGTWTVWCADDGVGMDSETILTKFLVLGASGKRSPGSSSVGGFGKAKELLILPWISWEIHSKNTIVVGQGTKYEADSTKGRQGTKITVVMAADMYTSGLIAENYIKKCYLPNIDFYVVKQDEATNKTDRARVWADLVVGRKLTDLTSDDKTIGALYYDADRKALKDQRLLVRAHGLFMFDKWMPGEVAGTIIAELTGKTVDLLTANRDEFRNYRVGYQIEEFTGKVAKDVKSALQEKTGMIRKKFKGSGRFVGARQDEFRAMLERKLLGLPEATESAETGKPMKFVPVHRDAIEESVRRISTPHPELSVPESKEEQPKGFFLNFTVPPEAVEAMISILMAGTNQIEAAAKQLAWQPDYFVMNNIPGYVPPVTFFPEKMSARNMKLIRLWAEICRFVLIQLNCSIPYGVGVCFDPDSAGMYTHDEDGHWLMFNPFVPKGSKSKVDPTTDRMLDYAIREDIFTLYAVAVHECTHMADGVTYHDETFSTALTYNFAKTSGKDRQIMQILKAIKARRPEHL